MKLIDQYQDIELIDALEERYLAYALTTIMDRALPDSRDGLSLYIEEFYMECLN